MPYRTSLPTHLALVVATGVAIAGAGCEAPPAPVPGTSPGSEPAAMPVAAQRGKAAPPRVAPGLAERLAPQEVTWPAPGAVDRDVRARFAAGELEALDRADLPVLAPRDEGVYGAVHVTTKPTWFALSLKDEAYAEELAARREKRPLPARGGLAVIVQGNRLAHEHPHIPPTRGKHTVRGVPGSITQNESIWSATWSENGVTYVVEVECSRPDDARCADEAVLVDVVESLVFVGGVGAPSPARAPGGAR